MLSFATLFIILYIIPMLWVLVSSFLNWNELYQADVRLRDRLQDQEFEGSFTVLEVFLGLFCTFCPIVNILYMIADIFKHFPKVVSNFFGFSFVRGKEKEVEDESK